MSGDLTTSSESHHLSGVSPATPALPHTSTYYNPAAELSNPISESEPLDYDVPNQPSSLLMFTNGSDYIMMFLLLSQRQQIYLSPFNHSSPSVASKYFSPAIPSSLQPTFDPSRLSIKLTNCMTAVHTPNWSTALLPQISTPKVLCRSINLNPLLHSLCQMTNTTAIPLSSLPMVMITWWTVHNFASYLPPSLAEIQMALIHQVFVFNRLIYPQSWWII